MRFLWSACCLLSLAVYSSACPKPEGHEHWDETRVMSSADLLLSVEFVAKNTKDKVVKVHTKVLCVVRNEAGKDKVEVPEHINITEVKEEDGEKCIDYLDSLEFGEPAFVMVKQEGEEFTTEKENDQGPVFYHDKVDKIKLMKDCGNIHPYVPTGGHMKTCPLVRAPEYACVDLTADPQIAASDNSTSSTLIPLSGTTMAGVMFLYRTLV